MTSVDPATKKLVQLQKIQKALDRVNDDTKQMVLEMAKGMSDLEIMQSFNQEVYDFFFFFFGITRQLGFDREYKIEAHNKLYEKAVKTNVSLPIEQFTMIILEFAPEIYKEDEECFLKMSIPDTKLETGNEFNVIRSEHFKDLWKKMNQPDKNDVKDKIILLTTFAHTYFYKTILSMQKMAN